MRRTTVLAWRLLGWHSGLWQGVSAHPNRLCELIVRLIASPGSWSCHGRRLHLHRVPLANQHLVDPSNPLAVSPSEGALLRNDDQGDATQDGRRRHHESQRDRLAEQHDATDSS